MPSPRGTLATGLRSLPAWSSASGGAAAARSRRSAGVWLYSCPTSRHRRLAIYGGSEIWLARNAHTALPAVHATRCLTYRRCQR